LVRFLYKKALPIALDIGHSSIKMLQLTKSNDELKVLAADEVTLPQDEVSIETRENSIIDAIKEIMSKGSFQGNHVIGCLSNEDIKVKSFRVSAHEAENIESIIENEAKTRFNLDPEIYNIDYINAGKIHQGNEAKTEMLIFAASKEKIDVYVNLIERAGLIPVAIDNVPCAMSRCLVRSLRREEDADAINVFVNIESKYTTLVISKGHGICFVKQIPLGGEDFNQKIATKLDISVEQASLVRAKLRRDNQGSPDNTDNILDLSTRQLIVDAMNSTISDLAREIVMCFKYFSITFRGKRPQKAIFSGGEAHEHMLIKELNRSLSVEIEAARPLSGFDVSLTNFSEDRRQSYCQWTVPVGLGLKNIKL
jgi:type IV pilus assembly protein PilM